MRTTRLQRQVDDPRHPRSGYGGSSLGALRAALAHPTALVLLILSVALATLITILPALRGYSGQARCVLLMGALAYAGAVFVVLRSRPERDAVELGQLRSIRADIARHLASYHGSGDREGSRLSGVLYEALAHLDHDLVPDLSQLLAREAELSRQLLRYERGQLWEPDTAVLDRLRAIHFRQRAAIDDCVRQAANANATLVAILQEGDDSRAASSASEWVEELLVLHDSLSDVLRAGPEARFDSALDANLSLVYPLPTSLRSAVVPPGPSGFEAELPRLVEEALRRINNPAALADCELVNVLPYTIDAARRGWPVKLAEPTPLEMARALREALAAAIERMRPAPEANGKRTQEVLHYYILHEEYIEGLANKLIVARHHISEATFHRYRREAVNVIARELWTQEEGLARQPCVNGHIPEPLSMN